MRYSAGMISYDITSPANERIKRLVRLRTRRHRDEEGVFLAEGPRLLDRALEAGLEPREVYEDGSLEKRYPNAVLVDPEVLDKASYRRASQGVLAVFENLPTDLSRISVSSPALLIAAESIEKPGNLGAMLRTAAAVGADALLTIDDRTDVFNPNVVRSSTGAIFDVPVGVTDLRSLRSWLDSHSISLVAATPEARLTMWEADLGGSCALLIGTEAEGLTDHAREHADLEVSIPMAGAIDSLNASVTAALLAYEARRQRMVR